MPDDTSYYSTRNVGLGESYVLLAEGRMLDGTPFAEVHLLSSAPRPRLRAMWFHVAQRPRRREDRLVDDFDLHELALRWATERLAADQRKWYHSLPPGTPYPALIDWTSRGVGNVVTLWVDGRFRAQLQRVARTTRGDHLRRLLEAAFTLPVATRERITDAATQPRRQRRLPPN